MDYSRYLHGDRNFILRVFNFNANHSKIEPLFESTVSESVDLNLVPAALMTGSRMWKGMKGSDQHEVR